MQVEGAFFQVDPRLRDDWVEVRYDPFSRPLETVLLYSTDGEYLGVGTRHEASEHPRSAALTADAQAQAQLPRPVDPEARPGLAQHHAGIDYQAVLAAAGRRWPFAEFVKQLAAHLGRKGGLTAFTTDELESLQKVYQRLTALDAPMLREACQRTTQRTIPGIVFLLQQLAHEKQRRT